ncbi:uncharacterized protein LOC106467545 [Limulus polyphemus]|uniref:Uncharacterized protein LOC106467545 n=1 Tax=Limulus polyphemus TaxID=6850 RepID=A0ABM1T6E6_LIMPO|nr:uncharacterized protein LOC106467545 [Limulus polyphemus]
MIAKIATLCALVAAVRGGLYHGLAGGSSVSSRRQDDFGNYAFNYDIVDPVGATNGRWEAGDGYGNKRGAYSLTDIDGRARRVEYVADGAGFRTVVKTNEPGTAASAPAAAVVASSQPGVVAHGPAVVKTHVAAAPAYAYKAPAYAYGASAYAAGIYGAPAYAAGVYRAPVYAAAYAAGIDEAPVYADGAYRAPIAMLCALVVVHFGLYHGLVGSSSVSSLHQNDSGDYDIIGPVWATKGRGEAGDSYGNKRGAYSLTDIDGRARRVEYVADGADVRAVVKTKEPDTAACAPAAAVVASNQLNVVAHGPAIAILCALVAAVHGGLYHGLAGGSSVSSRRQDVIKTSHTVIKVGRKAVKLNIRSRLSNSRNMIAKIAILCALVAAVHGGLYHGLAGGSSVSSRRQDDYGNYAFNYDIVDPVGATNGRWEAGDGYGNKRGAYSLTDIDGRARRVEYVADGAGFRAVVKTNEPGTAASAPAAAVVASSQPGVVAHGPAVVKAHVAAAPAYAYGAPAYAAGIYGAPAYAAGAYRAPVYAAGAYKAVIIHTNI